MLGAMLGPRRPVIDEFDVDEIVSPGSRGGKRLFHDAVVRG
jgi:hypothetical protein